MAADYLCCHLLRLSSDLLALRAVNSAVLCPAWCTLPRLLPRSYLNDNQFTGSPPATWGGPGAFPQLALLRLNDNRLTGGLPGSWGGNSSLPNLLVL